MRLIKITKLLLLGGAAAAVILGKRRSKAAPPDVRAVFDPPDVIGNADPGDPVQGLDEAVPFHDEDLEVDAETIVDIAIAQDLAELESEPSDLAVEVPMSPTSSEHARARGLRGSGELYGLHFPPAFDHDLPDDAAANAKGESWIEALGASATEHGAAVERQIDIVDEQDLDSPPTDTRDIPVADRGSGGPRGL